ncbi:MAG: hypothetical protein EOP62_01810 [Sphingomonadales bacterium]|nr:MAG: hypothetical protein EOP62_01810 [Sphingomonadales bacterium]
MSDAKKVVRKQPTQHGTKNVTNQPTPDDPYAESRVLEARIPVLQACLAVSAKYNGERDVRYAVRAANRDAPRYLAVTVELDGIDLILALRPEALDGTTAHELTDAMLARVSDVIAELMKKAGPSLHPIIRQHHAAVTVLRA